MSPFARAGVAALIIVASATAAGAAKRSAGGGGAIAPSAQDGALVGLHDLRREAGKICMVSHTHNGSSSGQPTKKAAEVAALRAWSSFTAWEYGDHWGNPMIAGDRKMNCNGGAGSFGCDFEARPCKRG